MLNPSAWEICRRRNTILHKFPSLLQFTMGNLLSKRPRGETEVSVTFKQDGTMPMLCSRWLHIVPFQSQACQNVAQQWCIERKNQMAYEGQVIHIFISSLDHSGDHKDCGNIIYTIILWAVIFTRVTRRNIFSALSTNKKCGPSRIPACRDKCKRKRKDAFHSSRDLLGSYLSRRPLESRERHHARLFLLLSKGERPNA